MAQPVLESRDDIRETTAPGSVFTSDMERAGPAPLRGCLTVLREGALATTGISERCWRIPVEVRQRRCKAVGGWAVLSGREIAITLAQVSAD
jgi:hypothetical protein